jgi:hypothetical protein
MLFRKTANTQSNQQKTHLLLLAKPACFSFLEKQAGGFWERPAFLFLNQSLTHSSIALKGGLI